MTTGKIEECDKEDACCVLVPAVSWGLTMFLNI